VKEEGRAHGGCRTSEKKNTSGVILAAFCKSILAYIGHLEVGLNNNVNGNMRQSTWF
jgi:hypothetical protein